MVTGNAVDITVDMTFQHKNSETQDARDSVTDQNELIDVIGLHGNQHLGDDVINNGFTATTQTDPRMLFSYDIQSIAIRLFTRYDWTQLQ